MHLGHLLGDRHQLGHRREGAAEVVLIEARGDHPYPPVGEPLADLDDPSIEELRLERTTASHTSFALRVKTRVRLIRASDASIIYDQPFEYRSGTALFITAQIAITGFVVLFLHEHRHVSTHAAAALLAGINVLAIGARIGSGRISDRMQTRLRPLRTIGIALTATTALVAALVDEPLAVLAPAFVVAGVLSMAWNGLAFAASAEVAGHARTGAALGFQQTLLGVVGAAAPPAFAAIAASSWRLAFALSALGPLLGVLTLSAISESGRTLGTSATPPAVP